MTKNRYSSETKANPSRVLELPGAYGYHRYYKQAGTRHCGIGYSGKWDNLHMCTHDTYILHIQVHVSTSIASTEVPHRATSAPWNSYVASSAEPRWMSTLPNAPPAPPPKKALR